MPRIPARTLALGVAAALLVGCSSSYHAGDQAAREWEAWVKDHPLDGARVTDTAGTNVQPFQGTFEAYARLTAEPSEATIVTAMASMCRFDKETSSSTTYWLQIDRVSVQAPCEGDQQERVARYWTAVHDLPGIVDLAYSTRGIALSAEDAALTALVPAVSAAGDDAGWAAATSTNTYTSKRITVTQEHGQDLSAELGLTQGVLDTVATHLTKVEVVSGRVSAATDGTVDEAHRWQGDVGQGSAVLAVTPARVTTEVALSTGARDLLDRLAVTEGVLSVEVLEPFWSITTPTTASARALVSLLDDEPATSDLGRLTVQVGREQRNSATGVGRTCYVRPVFPEKDGRAAALLDLCDQPGMVQVDDRFDVALDLRNNGTDLRSMLVALHAMPLGQQVYLQTKDSSPLEFATGATLAPKFPEADLAKQLVAIWERL